MKIDCLMGTYGRYSLACEALACFLHQTALSQATLLIYNQHPVPLRFDHSRVRIVNETAPARSLRHIRQRMHDLADPSAEFIHWWDDDDLYLPWHLADCLNHIAEHVAWKPASSWMSEENVRFSRHANVFEGSWIFRADVFAIGLLGYPPDLHGSSGYLGTPKQRTHWRPPSWQAELRIFTAGPTGRSTSAVMARLKARRRSAKTLNLGGAAATMYGRKES